MTSPMKKILIAFIILFTVSMSAQIASKKELVDLFKVKYKYSKDLECFVILDLLESNYGVTDETDYFKTLVSFSSMKFDISNKKTVVITTFIDKLDRLILENKLSAQRIENLKYFKTLRKFDLLKYSSHHSKFTPSERAKNVKEIIAACDYFISDPNFDKINKSSLI
jgi:hypothetical protein